jgi:hypothetical protein
MTVAEVRREDSVNRYTLLNALIDSGATYNFILQDTVERLHLKAIAGSHPPPYALSTGPPCRYTACIAMHFIFEMHPEPNAGWWQHSTLLISLGTTSSSGCLGSPAIIQIYAGTKTLDTGGPKWMLRTARYASKTLQPSTPRCERKRGAYTASTS